MLRSSFRVYFTWLLSIYFWLQVWFQNRRAKFRRNERCSIRSSPSMSHQDVSSHVSSSSVINSACSNVSIDNVRKHSSTILPTASTTMLDKCNLHSAHSQMDLTSSAHYAMGFPGLEVVSLPTSRTNGYTYGTSTYNAYSTANANRSNNPSCSYLPTTYCGPPTPNYNNLGALRYKTHGYPSI